MVRQVVLAGLITAAAVGAAAESPQQISSARTADSSNPRDDRSQSNAAATFGVPKPGDAEWQDYQEMLRHQNSSLQGTSGYAMPYDPEWRSELTGKREVPATDAVLAGGAGSLRLLGQALVESLQRQDAARVSSLLITREEFETILWPEFPQSRPFLKIPVAEAWSFHVAHCNEGLREALESYGGQAMKLQAVQFGRRIQYRNFVLYRDVSLQVIDGITGEPRLLQFMPAIVERRGRFKAYIFDGSGRSTP